jgi:septum formation protein
MAGQARPAFVLASGSTGRLGLLHRAGIDPEVVVSGVDESTEAGLDTSSAVAVLAERKAAAVAAQRPDALVLGCDSLLELDGMSFGKPATEDEAVHRWRTLSGREGRLLTGHCLIEPGQGRRVRAVASTTVRFGTPTDAEVSAYVASGEPVRVAGAFTIDGLGAPFIEGIDGDPGNVVGLSLPLLRRMLADAGVRITDLWRTAAIQGAGSGARCQQK